MAMILIYRSVTFDKLYSLSVKPMIKIKGKALSGMTEVYQGRKIREYSDKGYGRRSIKKGYGMGWPDI